MICFQTDQFEVELPPGHRFPIGKYRMLRQRLQDHSEIQLRVAESIAPDQLKSVHTHDYIDRVLANQLTPAEVRRLGFPLSPALVQRGMAVVGATLQACRTALKVGRAANLAGGTHHSYPDHGEGYCLLNDVAVALRQLLLHGDIKRAVIVDLDVHQGNGNAAIFADDPNIFTFSMHGKNNYPFRKERSDLDIELPDGCDDQHYLDSLVRALEIVKDQPADLWIYLAGADPFYDDTLGKLSLSEAGLLERDRLVQQAFDGPIAVTMAGGYAKDIADVANIQARSCLLFSGLSTAQVLQRLPARNPISKLEHASASSLAE
jgi:acetoin utilization deacetylase AcuC-like enzyme